MWLWSRGCGGDHAHQLGRGAWEVQTPLPGSEEWGWQNSPTRSLILGLKTWMDAAVSGTACPGEDAEVLSGCVSHGSCSPSRLPRAL